MRKNMSLKKFAKVVVLSLALCMTTQTVAPLSTAVVAEAATTVKLNVKKKTLTEGKSFTLKVKGTSKKVTFSSSKKSVATVNKNGKVTAKKAGKANITAKVGNKKYVCKVTVKAKENKYVTNAPFKAVEVKLGDNSVVVPKDWSYETGEIGGMTLYSFMPKDADITKGTSSVSITCTATDAQNEDYDLYLEYLKQMITEDYLKASLSASINGELELKDFDISTKEMEKYKVSVISYSVMLNGEKVMEQKIYDVFANGYTTEVTVTDNGTELTTSVDEVAEYMLESLTFKK